MKHLTVVLLLLASLAALPSRARALDCIADLKACPAKIDAQKSWLDMIAVAADCALEIEICDLRLALGTW